MLLLATVGNDGEDESEFFERSLDIKNDVSDLTVDSTNKSERFSSTTILDSQISTSLYQLRLSEAFVLQTADKSYDKIPSA